MQQLEITGLVSISDLFSKKSINVEFFELPQCFTFRIILWFYAILRVFVLYSHYGDSSSSKKLNEHLAFESESPWSTCFFFEQYIS